MTRPALTALVLVLLLSAPAAAQDPGPTSAPTNPGATLVVRHADTLGPSYQVEAMAWTVDRRALGAARDFDHRPARRRQLREGARAAVRTGGTEVAVQAVVRGVGTGEFAFLNRYRLVIDGTCAVDLLPEQTTTLDVVLVRDAGPFAEFEAGIGIECRSHTRL